MGTVHLTNGHRGLHIRTPKPDIGRWVLLEAEMLERPVLKPNGEGLPEHTGKMIRAALQGLALLQGFDAAASFCVLEKDSALHISTPLREWAEITFGSPDNVIVPFSHDTRYDNYPFRCVQQWLEIDSFEHVLSAEVLKANYQHWSNPERWHQFYLGRIQEAVEVARSKAQRLNLNASQIAAMAKVIEAALKK